MKDKNKERIITKKELELIEKEFGISDVLTALIKKSEELELLQKKETSVE